jgi:hypothetical protein
MDCNLHINLSRGNIKSAIAYTKLWILNHKNQICTISKNEIRNDVVCFNIEHYHNVLKNIKFIYNDIDQHWAETDGESIWLNTFKIWTYPLLVYTLIHECIHGLVKRKGIYDIPEKKEHNIMKKINNKLIDV